MTNEEILPAKFYASFLRILVRKPATGASDVDFTLSVHACYVEVGEAPGVYDFFKIGQRDAGSIFIIV